MRSFCPSGKQSCIGQYPRKVLSLKQTIAWIVYWCLDIVGFIDLAFEVVFLKFKEEWGRETLFWICNIRGVVANEGFHLFVPVILSVPSNVEKPQALTFMSEVYGRPLIVSTIKDMMIMSMIAVHLICSRYLERLQRVQTVQTQLDLHQYWKQSTSRSSLW